MKGQNAEYSDSDESTISAVRDKRSRRAGMGTHPGHQQGASLQEDIGTPPRHQQGASLQESSGQQQERQQQGQDPQQQQKPQQQQLLTPQRLLHGGRQRGGEAQTSQQQHQEQQLHAPPRPRPQHQQQIAGKRKRIQLVGRKMATAIKEAKQQKQKQKKEQEFDKDKGQKFDRDLGEHIKPPHPQRAPQAVPRPPAQVPLADRHLRRPKSPVMPPSCRQQQNQQQNQQLGDRYWSGIAAPSGKGMSESLPHGQQIGMGETGKGHQQCATQGKSKGKGKSKSSVILRGKGDPNHYDILAQQQQQQQLQQQQQAAMIGAKKSTQTFFVQSFLKTLPVMDVRTKNRRRPHQKVRFSAAPVMGRKFLTQGRPGVRVRNVRGKSGPKSLCLRCFFFPEMMVMAKGMAMMFNNQHYHQHLDPFDDNTTRPAGH